MKNLFKTTVFLTLLTSLTSCGFMDHVERRAGVLNSLEDKVLVLNKKNQAQRNEIMQLKFKLKSVESRNFYLESQLQNKGKPTQRTIASVRKVNADDLVKFDVYKWKPHQMLAIAEKEFDGKNYEKSAQFFKEFSTHFPNDEALDDKFLFQAGVASFEAGKHYQWSEKYFGSLVEKYPTSKFYLGSKLWLGMSYLKQGKEKEFFAVVEEFRKKYRNTPEWNILSGHYEKIVQKYKSN
ncbi:MAG: hypothetical protein BM556_02080 [Bacteriovorax sp. MedPE-SWde]|nr:MAG: hypothetical protein BM556_02080 [Bacteriovorax sp. MedPE-SWde]